MPRGSHHARHGDEGALRDEAGASRTSVRPAGLPTATNVPRAKTTHRGTAQPVIPAHEYSAAEEEEESSEEDRKADAALARTSLGLRFVEPVRRGPPLSPGLGLASTQRRSRPPTSSSEVEHRR